MLKKRTTTKTTYEWRIDKEWLIFAKPKYQEDENRGYWIYEFYLQSEIYGYIEFIIALELCSIKTIYLNIDNFVEQYIMSDINLYKNQLIRTNTLYENLINEIESIEYMIKNTPWECTNCEVALKVIKELL